jgi:hypothetical protein
VYNKEFASLIYSMLYTIVCESIKLEKTGNIAGFGGVSRVRGYGNEFLKIFFKKVLTDVEKSSIIEKYQAEYMKI